MIYTHTVAYRVIMDDQTMAEVPTWIQAERLATSYTNRYKQLAYIEPIEQEMHTPA